MKMAPWIGFSVALFAAGCSKELNPDSGDGGPGTGIVDGTEDNDTRGDDDTDPVDDAIVDCRSEYDTPENGGVPSFGECTTDQLFCGDFVQATTVGGSTHYDTDQYLAALFATGSENWDGPERVYQLRQNVGEVIRVTFYGPCADMKLGVCAGWDCEETEAVQAGDCSSLGERDSDGGMFREFPAPTSGVRRHELIVDGRDGAQGNFGLRIECFYP
ncbi:MAG: hypothetical protein ACJA00_004386 [Myxococcota bacterium]|jgi:hypothetical protein